MTHDIKALLLEAAELSGSMHTSRGGKAYPELTDKLRAAAASMGDPLAVYDHQCCEDHAAALEVEIHRRWEGNEISAREHAEEIAAIIKNSMIGPPAESLGEPVLAIRNGNIWHTEAYGRLEVPKGSTVYLYPAPPPPAVPDGWREAIGRVRDNVCPGGEGAVMRAEREIAGVCLDAVEEELAMIEAATEQPKAGAAEEPCCCGESEQAWRLCPIHGPEELK